jgi:hypothetical protein
MTPLHVGHRVPRGGVLAGSDRPRLVVGQVTFAPLGMVGEGRARNFSRKHGSSHAFPATVCKSEDRRPVARGDGEMRETALIGRLFANGMHEKD